MGVYQRRENLCFYGIEEDPEDTQQVLINFLQSELGIVDASNIEFQRVSPFNQQAPKPCQIIAHFLRYPDMVDRGDHKVKEFKEDLDEVRVLAGSGRSGTKDGSKTSASFSQPTAVCCEEGADTVYVLDTSIGRLKMITSTLALTTFLENLWKFLTAFQLTSEDVSGLEEAIDPTQSYYSFLEKASLKVQQIKGSTAKTQGPDGTLSSSTLNSVEMILLGLNRLKEDVIHLNPEYLQDIEVRSLLTLFVENFFSSMRGGNTITPTVLDFCRRFPRCTNELLKRVMKNPFNYFTNPKASYYMQPSMKDVLIQFLELTKLPMPSKSSLAPKQITDSMEKVSVKTQQEISQPKTNLEHFP